MALDRLFYRCRGRLVSQRAGNKILHQYGIRAPMKRIRMADVIDLPIAAAEIIDLHQVIFHIGADLSHGPHDMRFPLKIGKRTHRQSGGDPVFKQQVDRLMIVVALKDAPAVPALFQRFYRIGIAFFFHGVFPKQVILVFPEVLCRAVRTAAAIFAAVNAPVRTALRRVFTLEKLQRAV